MKDRNISAFIEELALKRKKMAFLSGPRQAGKTTLAKQFLGSKGSYYSWESAEFRKIWTKQYEQLGRDLAARDDSSIVLDEFHKNLKWKNQLKSFYDQYGDSVEVIVTGSAKLNQFRKGADSLMGRFLHFNVLPFSLGELQSKKPIPFDEFQVRCQKCDWDVAEEGASGVEADLFRLTGFPEPFLASRDQIYQLWQKNRTELLIRQDLKDLSQIINIGHLEILASFLPDRVGSPLSIQSLREDLDVAHTTISRWLNALSMVYFHFEVKPYSTNVVRSLKKEGKVYLFDYGQVEDQGSRFENLVAFHLYKLVHFYSDTGQADLSLHYLRNKDREEVDFILLNRKKPVLTVEVKQNEQQLDPTFLRFQKNFKVPHYQIISKKNHLKKIKTKDREAYVIGFDRFFGTLP